MYCCVSLYVNVFIYVKVFNLCISEALVPTQCRVSKDLEMISVFPKKRLTDLSQLYDAFACETRNSN